MGELYEKKERTYHEVLPDLEERKEMAAYLGRWVWYLFWLVIPGLIAGLMNSSLVSSSTVRMAGDVLTICTGVVYGVILLVMGKKEGQYTFAGISYMVAMIVTVLGELIGESVIAALLYLVVVSALTVYTEYKEFYGHSTVLGNYDFAFSEKWKNLWKWYLGCNVVIVGSTFLLLVGSIVTLLAALLLLGGTIALLVASIIKLVYLYRMAKLLRNFSGE
ncbi:hypothetical protein H9X85_06405 [Anaerotignum lactatifermentans]|uniref:Uncharacterized protein n=1 Tax=Anaerotignum lactatifermentans TaxID=160404 RepID=A0ABS2G7N5_9FIRM|nr:hypothetical protein [Anaerotignum lactatifermentans]MBM6829269.1 hypothetical protein [Anaerotignum lactatifermentans]MBM6877491.1 hypothetical protein [Anaerotignum lactatifermentans]MBM6950847.1 hypothetical protein [Anaerotignum lactatifermentans]